jgi:DNA-binding CsgD family transcriptional regulator
MHTRKASFNKFFKGFEGPDFDEMLKVLGCRITEKPADICSLKEPLNEAEDFLKQTDSFLLITDLRTLSFIHASDTALQVTGFPGHKFLNEGAIWFMKNYCPADRINGMKALKTIMDHQKETETNEKSLYQYILTFRFLNNNGYYIWMYNRIMFISHDDEGKPWIMVSLLSSMKHFKANDNISFTRLKFNRGKGIYETQESQELEPEYLDILSSTDLKILKLLAEGFNNRQIAERLNYTEHTIKAYRKKMLKKTWCNNTAELLSFSLRNKLIK